MTYQEGLRIADEHGMKAEFVAAYRFFKPWWAFWRSEAQAVADALDDWDLYPLRMAAWDALRRIQVEEGGTHDTQ